MKISTVSSKNPFFTVMTAAAALLALAAFNLSAAAETERATGHWKWSFTIPNGDTINISMKIKQEANKLTGTYESRGRESKIEEGKISGNDISFKVTREREGQSFVVKYAGKLSGDTIKGKAETSWGDETRSFDWEATRVKETANATGTWNYTFTTSSGQTFSPKAKLKQSGNKLSGAVIWNENETDISDGKLEGDQISFKVLRERSDGRKVTARYQGKLEGDSIKGKIISDWSGEDQTFDWEAKRAKE